MYKYIHCLCNSLNLPASTLVTIQSITVQSNDDTCNISTPQLCNHLDQTMQVPLDQPSCSSWNDGFIDIESVPESACLSQAQIERRLAKKRATSKSTYEHTKRRRLSLANKKYKDPVKGQKKRDQSTKDYKDPVKGQKKRDQSTKDYKDPVKGQKKRDQSKNQSKKDYSDPVIKRAKIQQTQINRLNRNSNMATIIAQFKKSCHNEQLIYKCVICRRIHFKRQVVAFKTDKYNTRALQRALPSGTLFERLPTTNDNNNHEAWICKTCHNTIKTKQTIPTLACINKLDLHEQPPQLSELNMLERHLISPAIPFMKMIPLIKGCQKGIHGQVVCVKSDINSTAQSLPRLPTDESLIRVKLKRKLNYKGHVMCQDVNPSRLQNGLLWLKDNNPEYEDIDIDFEEFDGMMDDQLIQDDRTESISDNEMIGNNTETEQESSQSRENNENETNEHDQDRNENVTNTSAPLYSFLHPVDFAQYVADKHDTTILALAPGEGNTPQNVLDMEAKCFPVEFPDGANTYVEERNPKVSPSRYFNSRLFSADNRFASNPEYIFFSLYATELHHILSNVSIASRIGSSRLSDGRQITASMLRNRQEVLDLMKRDEGYRFLASIRGTPAYWEKSKREVFAMVRQLGIPTFFVTFSAADRRWIEIDNAILIQQGKPPMTPEEHNNMTWDQHCRIIMSNPVTAARIFENRVQTFIKDVIMSKAEPIGKVEDYFYRTEFQQRGWPHIHMIVWVKDAPKLDVNTDDEIVKFVDDKITCAMPSPETDPELYEILSSVQMHSKNHTKSCRKTKLRAKIICRYLFPRPPCIRTFICRPNGIIVEQDDENYEAAVKEKEAKEKKAREIIESVWQLILSEDHNFEQVDQVLREANITQSDFEESLEILSSRTIMYLKRGLNEQWVNNYNADLIRAWNGNMDIQYVLNPYACIMYMVSYITKAEREMGDLLTNAQKEAAEGNDDAVSQLRKLGGVYLQNREISVMGAIYQTCSMPLKKSTRNVIFLQTDLNGQKISLPLKTLQANAGKTDQVWMPTQIEKYIARPGTQKYNDMCMATFYSRHYQLASSSATNDSDAETDEESESEIADEDMQHDVQNQSKSRQRIPPIKLQNNLGKMKERERKPAVIRYPRVSVKKDSERYHMNMLRLYLPHRNENIKPDDFATYQSYHLTGFTIVQGKRVAVKEVVAKNMKDFEPSTDDFDNAYEALQEAADIQEGWATIAAENEQQRRDDDDERLLRNIANESDDEFDEVVIPELQPSRNRTAALPTCRIESRNPVLTDEQAHCMMRQLNSKQRQLFNHVSKWCNEKSRDSTVEPFNIFLTGGAGTGKSHVIRCIQHQAQKAFAPLTESADDITVLLVAQTGTAAFNISGQTINSAFKINPKSPKDYRPLGEESVNTLRAKFQHLQLLIIDEISMVSATMLSYIHGRLQQIKGTHGSAWFGNISVLAVGDFHQLPPISPPRPLCFPHPEILKDLWNPRFQIVELTEIMRQRDDAVFAQMLNRLRVRTKDEPLLEEDEQLLKSRIVDADTLPAPPDVLHLFYLNKDVDTHNDAKLQSLDTETHTIKAVDVDQKGGRVLKVNDIPHNTSRKDDTNLAPYVKLAVNARAMLIANVDVSDGLCNGVSGIIKGIVFGESPNMPKAVYVKFDNERVGANARKTQSMLPEYTGCVAIVPRDDTFQMKGRTYTTTRQQVPLKLAWAVTIHKVQGQTTEQAVISLKGLRTSMAYVALSRVTTLDGMYLTDFNSRSIFCNKDIDAEVVKMPLCNVSRANPMVTIDHNKHFIIAHHNIQSLRAHIEDLRQNSEIRKAHVICLSETWLTDNDSQDTISIDGYTLETVNFGRGKGVAIYIQNSVNYMVVPLVRSTDCNALAIRTHGASNLLIVAVYKPVTTSTAAFCTEMNKITAQTELLDVDYAVFTGDFNHNLLKDAILPPFRQYHQVISEPTTAKGTLLDHIYIKPRPTQYVASVLTTYYSYHDPVFVAINIDNV